MRIIKKRYSTKELAEEEALISIRNQEIIKKCAQDLHQIGNISNFCLYLKTPFNSPFHITTALQWCMTYNKFGFEKIDLTCDPVKGFASTTDDSYCIAEKKLNENQQYLYSNMAANDINETVAVVRRCKEAYIVGVFHHQESIDNPTKFYWENKSDLEEFMGYFINGVSNIIEKENNALFHTPFIQKKKYQSDIIRQNHDIKPLSKRETQIIKLLATNLSIFKIADVLSLTEKTIRNYIENIHKKLGTHTLWLNL